MNKRKIINSILLLIIIGLGIYLISKSINKDSITMDDSRGQIEYLEGFIEKKSVNDIWNKIDKGEIIKNGDEIRTLDNSRAIITFEDGSFLRLDENTDIKVDSIGDNINIDLNNGTIFNNVSKHKSREYSVKSDDFNIVALGTAFSVMNKKNSVDVMVLESSVDVRDLDGKIIKNIKTGEKLNIKDKKLKKEEISKIDIEDNFMSWSISESNIDFKIDDDSSVDIKLEPVSKKIDLSAKKVSDGIKLTWSVNGIDITKGFKVVMSESKNPTYPIREGDSYKYLQDNNKRSFVWNIQDGKTYYFRVCQYLGGKCGIYSDNIKISAPLVVSDDTYATLINLSISNIDNNAKLEWNIDGGGAPKGYKVVMSENANPEYPTRDGDSYHYIDNESVNDYTWSNLEAGKTYHFRVCIYKGGSCGAYSDDVTMTVTGEIQDEYADSIILSVDSGVGKANLSWTINGGSAPKGYKVVMSKNINPEYPTRDGDSYNYLEASDIRSYTWSNLDSGNYHFRVCIYDGNGSCVKYSNDVLVAVENSSSDGYATSVKLYSTYGENSVDLIWNIDGGGAPKGYKVVMSENANPEYPTRDGDSYHYIDNESVNDYTWSNLEAGKTYHFRVCIYKGGSCGAYSDDVEVNL